MNRLSRETHVQILAMLCEGMALRAISRVADVSINTVTKLLVDAGSAALDYQDRVMVKLPCRRVRCDEIWSFVYAKQRNVPPEFRGEFGYGDVWTWVALCADTKLVPCWHVGARNAGLGADFMLDLAPGLANRVQLTMDGHRAYLEAVETGFGAGIDYAMLIKLYGQPPGQEDERPYSPPECIGIDVRMVSGYPDPDHISTSFVERQILTMRMHMRRFTGVTNPFSKKLENQMHAISLHYLHYNFCRIHKSFRVTPAIAPGVTDMVHDMDWIVGLVEDAIPLPGPRGPYRKRNSN